MKAFVSSESPVKHAAVSAAFAKVGLPIETVAVPMSSSVSEQPMSIDETYEGAVNRHQKLVDAVGAKADGYFLITVESGIATLRPEHNYFGVDVVVVERNGEKRVGIDVDVEFPRSMTDRIPHDYADVGELVKAEYGAETKDPYPYFTNGKRTRRSFIEHALGNVLVQFDDLSQPGFDALGKYERYVQQASAMLETQGILLNELVQCDMINYECDTNERYAEVKEVLLRSAEMVSEIEHGGRLVSIYQAHRPLLAGQWNIPYIELLQPKPTRENRDAIDGIFFVTATSLVDFLERHQDIPFDTKGLTNSANPYVEMKVNDVAVKFHDRHMGAVLGIEQALKAI